MTVELALDFLAGRFAKLFDAIIDATRVPYQAPSLGGVETLIELPVTMSYWDYDPKDRAEWGITDSLCRLACGIENAEDLIADMDQALEKV